MITKKERFEVEIDTEGLESPERRMTGDGYQEPVIEKIVSKLDEIDEVESVRRLR